MQIFEVFSPAVFMSMDCFSIQHCLLTMLGNLILPLVLIVILVGIMGGNMQSMAESIGDVLASCLVLALDLSLRLLKVCCLTLICVLSATVRILLSWRAQRSIKLKVVDEPDPQSSSEKSGSKPV